MSGMIRDRMAEPVSRGQILGRARGQGKITFFVELTTSRTGDLNHTRLIRTLLCVMAIRACIHMHIHIDSGCGKIVARHRCDLQWKHPLQKLP